MRSESIKIKWLLGESHSELRSQSLKHGPASLYFDNLKQAILNGELNSLKEFLQHEDYRCVVNFKGPDGFALIHIAALQSDSASIDVLVDAGTRPNLHDFEGRAALHLVVSKSGCRCPPCIKKRLQCIEVLMSRGANPDAEDKLGETPLYYAARNRLAECATLLLEKGSDLQHWNENSTVVTLILEYIPSVMCKELDKCVSSDCTDSLLLKVDFSLLMQVKAIQEGFRKRLNSKEDLYQDRPPRETELLRHILRAATNQDTIVTHPVVETFIHFKWLSVRKFFFILRSIYFLLTMLYTYIMFNLYSFSKYNEKGIVFSSPPKDIIEPEVSTVEPPGVIEEIVDHAANDLDYHVLLLQSTSGSLLACALIIVLSEVYKICQDAANYHSNPSGYLWWILAAVWTGTLCPPHIPGFSLEHWHFPIASFGVIYTWLMNMVQLGRIPWFAVHVALLVNVVTDFLKLLFTFALILVGFMFGFCILIPNNYYFESFTRATFKVFIMMKGDIDYEMTLDRHNNPLMSFPGYSIPAHILFTSFVMIVTMLLTALLIALAVMDIEEVQSKAQVNRSIRLIKEISIFESLIRNRFLTCGLSTFLIKRFSIESRPEIVNSSLTICPTCPMDSTLPLNLKKLFLPYLEPSTCQIRRRFRKDYIPIPANSNNNLLEESPHFEF